MGWDGGGTGSLSHPLVYHATIEAQQVIYYKIQAKGGHIWSKARPLCMSLVVRKTLKAVGHMTHCAVRESKVYSA